VASIAGADADRTGSIAPAAPAPPLSGAGGESGLTEVEPDGVLEEVGGDVIISDPSQPPPLRLAAAPREDLVEVGEHGLLPRIGDDGTTPLDAYARPVDEARNMKRVAIVIGGIGIEGETVGEAVAALPGAVTLALAPYGEDLPAALAAARAGGHEVLLQIPLEPYNYPDTDPGPHTLTTDATREENLDRLHWLLGRATTYVGVMNYMGARFTSEDGALAPVLAEIGARGLLFLDDGSSTRSRAAALAEGKVPFLEADLVLDADTAPAAIDARLDQLAAIARERGYAIGAATAFPTTVARVAAFAAAAERRGIVLVPVSDFVRAGRL
jgi:polysaccharide deacetylase 2 family uncharacterized protein YibQ